MYLSTYGGRGRGKLLLHWGGATRGSCRIGISPGACADIGNCRCCHRCCRRCLSLLPWQSIAIAIAIYRYCCRCLSLLLSMSTAIALARNSTSSSNSSSGSNSDSNSSCCQLATCYKALTPGTHRPPACRANGACPERNPLPYPGAAYSHLFDKFTYLFYHNNCAMKIVGPPGFAEGLARGKERRAYTRAESTFTPRLCNTGVFGGFNPQFVHSPPPSFRANHNSKPSFQRLLRIWSAAKQDDAMLSRFASSILDVEFDADNYPGGKPPWLSYHHHN